MKAEEPVPQSAVYLCAPVNALVEGIYEENISLAEIRKHGDFGLGTFNNLDGEMVMLDGRTYQIDSAGSVREVPDDVLSPFACVTFYRPLCHDEICAELSYEGFLKFINGLLPSPNIFYAIRAEGVFEEMTVRSVPRQENYRPLAEVAKEQPVFSWKNTRGTLVGFFTPAFMASVSVPGLHLHFLSEDLRYGGHLLSCRPRSVCVGVQLINKLELSLPLSLDYLTWDFTRDVAGDLEKVEK